MESELSELSDLASEEPDKAEKMAAAEKELKDEDKVEELHPRIEREREEPKSPSRPEQSLPQRDKAKTNDSRKKDFPGGTLGKFHVTNDLSAIFDMSLFGFPYSLGQGRQVQNQISSLLKIILIFFSFCH
jgi:hypothetical protein